MIQTTIEEGELRWFGDVMRIREDKAVGRVFETRTKKREQQLIQTTIEKGLLRCFVYIMRIREYKAAGRNEDNIKHPNP